MPAMTSAALCVVLGAPRSGTTWLQRLLASSPHVVTPQETHLFAQYLQPQWVRWRRHEAQLARAVSGLRTGAVDSRIVGLPTILAEDDLVSGQFALVERVVERALAAKPGACMVLEKTPSNSLCVDVIDRVCPQARFLHIVRDPRDVMASLRDVAGRWANWGPQSSGDAARIWLNHYREARKAAVLGPSRYLEVRYEELVSNPKRTLAEVLDFLGLPDDAGVLVESAEALDGASFDSVFAFRPELAAHLHALPGAEPIGFRSGGRRPLRRLALRSAEAVLGEQARGAGFTDGWPRVSGPERRILRALARFQDLHSRTRRMLHWRTVGAW